MQSVVWFQKYVLDIIKIDKRMINFDLYIYIYIYIYESELGF